ncbi:MAG: DUF3791 domain-containing protein [Bacteroidaceae bacterium]|nr:DUF3791 domain-containing protein [Bacteroidaceae bacterium]
MSKYEIPYINLIIRTFAERFQMSRQAAYAYLQKYNGLSFLIEFYDVEHLQDPEETVDDLIVKCQQQGGTLTC